MGSTRLPGKVLLPAAGKPMLAHQIDRLRKVRYANQLVIATSEDTLDDAIVEFCAGYGTATFRGSQEDVLSRFAGAAKAYDAEVVVRLTADCPLIDPMVIDHVISAFLESPSQRLYVSNTLERTYPRGMDVEAFSCELLEEVNQLAISAHDREHVTPLLIRNERNDIIQRNIPYSKNISAYRFTLDYPKDYHQIKQLLESNLPDYSLGELMRRAVELRLDWHDNAEQGQGQGQGQSILARFGIGSAQFGMHYGRFNQDGVPSKESTKNILERACEYSLSVIDTAHLYGESEFVLGQCGRQLDNFHIVTKTPHFSNEAITKADVRLLREAFENSLRLMHLPGVYGLLIHDANNLLAPGSDLLYDELLDLKKEGLVLKIGVSGYSGDSVESIHQRFPLDLVQLPVNLLDRRLTESGALSRLASAGIEIHARSAFLQGLLLADPATLSTHFEAAKPVLVKFHAAAKTAGISSAHAALHYLLAIPEIDRIIVGVESMRQFEQLFDGFPPPPEIDFSEFRIDQVEILNPVLWVN